MTQRNFPVGLVLKLIPGIVGFLLLALFMPQLVETNEAGFVQIKQAAITGELTCRTEPGMYGQWFGTIHTYPEADTFYFTADTDSGASRDQSLPTRFNDGAKAKVSGSVRVLTPLNCEDLVRLHRKFHSHRGVMEKLVLPAVRKALFNTGPHMSAAESYAERRAEFAELAEDQLVNGIIKVDKEGHKTIDELTGEEKIVFTVTKLRCTDASDPSCIGGFLRQPSPFHEFNVGVTNFVIDEIQYGETVLKQIERQRQARMDIITQQAEAKQADARAAKAEAEARAKVAETRAEAEVAKTKQVVAAEAKREVARLDAEAAKLEMEANIARGKGEAERKRLVMQADGALSKKLEAWVEVQKAYADALSKAQPGALVPYLMMGGGNEKSSGISADQWISLMAAKAARDISLDMRVPKQK